MFTRNILYSSTDCQECLWGYDVSRTGKPIEGESRVFNKSSGIVIRFQLYNENRIQWLIILIQIFTSLSDDYCYAFCILNNLCTTVYCFIYIYIYIYHAQSKMFWTQYSRMASIKSSIQSVIPKRLCQQYPHQNVCGTFTDQEKSRLFQFLIKPSQTDRVSTIMQDFFRETSTESGNTCHCLCPTKLTFCNNLKENALEIRHIRACRENLEVLFFL
jgi:hypothetical protein